jgi:hypothetical protein
MRLLMLHPTAPVSSFIPKGRIAVPLPGNWRSVSMPMMSGANGEAADCYPITSEDAIVVGSDPGNLFYPEGEYPGDRTGPIPATFPKGFDGFYLSSIT